MPPEELARQQIDAHLAACGWQVQDYKKLNLGAGRGIAVREVPLVGGKADYLLFVDRKPQPLDCTGMHACQVEAVAKRE